MKCPECGRTASEGEGHPDLGMNIYACKCGHRWDEEHVDPAGTSFFWVSEPEYVGKMTVRLFDVPFNLFNEPPEGGWIWRGGELVRVGRTAQEVQADED